MSYLIKLRFYQAIANPVWWNNYLISLTYGEDVYRFMTVVRSITALGFEVDLTVSDQYLGAYNLDFKTKENYVAFVLEWS